MNLRAARNCKIFRLTLPMGLFIAQNYRMTSEECSALVICKHFHDTFMQIGAFMSLFGAFSPWPLPAFSVWKREV